MTRIKICGLTRREDAELAVELGADAVGFVVEPTSPRCVDPAELPWLEDLAPFVTRVAVFGEYRSGLDLQQFDAMQTVKGGVGRRIQALRVAEGESPVLALSRIAPGVHAVVLDAHVAGQYGGTGQTIDWGVAEQIVALSTVPVILAGGLTPANVAEAIRRTRPYAVDVSSGVESEPGMKSADRLRAFFAAVEGV
ncbi:MAG: phosphoribosylanthranilate isomerase [Chthonomonas sp.]|nr:phosphoribosylanthranilate isomerase [Chthonomonas sp.]